jgi:hypothetical protein
LQYNEQFKRQKKLMKGALGPQSIANYYPLILSETCKFIRNLNSNPLSYMDMIRKYAGGLTLCVVYGHQPESPDDVFLRLAEDCLDILANDIAVGTKIWPVDVFPILKHLPSWLPGCQFKRDAIVWKKKIEEFVDKPFQYVKNRLVSCICGCICVLQNPSIIGLRRTEPVLLLYAARWRYSSYRRRGI